MIIYHTWYPYMYPYYIIYMLHIPWYQHQMLGFTMGFMLKSARFPGSGLQLPRQDLNIQDHPRHTVDGNAKSESPVDRSGGKHLTMYRVSTCFNNPVGGAGFRVAIHSMFVISVKSKISKKHLGSIIEAGQVAQRRICGCEVLPSSLRPSYDLFGSQNYGQTDVHFG